MHTSKKILTEDNLIIIMLCEPFMWVPIFYIDAIIMCFDNGII